MAFARPLRARPMAWLSLVMMASLVASCSGTAAPGSPTGGTAVTSTSVTGSPTGAAPATSSSAVDCDSLSLRTGSGWYETNPTYRDPVDDSADWVAASPTGQGVDVATLTAGVKAIQNSSLTSVLVVRSDELVFERYLNGTDKATSSNIHSASKTLLGAALAVAVREGFLTSLDALVSDLLPEYFVNASAEKRGITIRHLMTMSSGLAWTDDETEYRIEKSSDWVKAVLDQPLVATPGRTFNYSTGATHVLSAVLQRASGMSTCQFVHQYLLTPMNVAAEHWGRDPQGISSGGYNVYLTPRDMAKFGLLLLNGGSWKGRQLVPSSFIAEAQQPRFVVDSTYSYGELVWLRTIAGHQVFFAWGWGGQFIYVIPDYDVVLVATENTNDGHDNLEVDLGPFIQDYLLPALS